VRSFIYYYFIIIYLFMLTYFPFIINSIGQIRRSI